MRRLCLRILVVLLTFAIGVAAASVWGMSRITEAEGPPCRECSEVYASAEIPTVPLARLQAAPEEYRGRLVRVSETFSHDAGYIYLSGARGGEGGLMYAGMTDSCGACSGVREALTIYSGYRSWYDGTARVVAVGRLGRIEGERNFFRGRDGFNILCLESAEPIGSGIRHRIYYVIGRMAKVSY